MNFFNWARARAIAIYVATGCAILVFGAGLLLMVSWDKGLGHNRGWFLIAVFGGAVWVFFKVWSVLEARLLRIYNGNNQNQNQP